MKLFKKVMLLISILSFALQCRIAIEKLSKPPTASLLEIVKVSEIDPPLITVCAEQKTFKFEISKQRIALEDFLKGKFGNDTVS